MTDFNIDYCSSISRPVRRRTKNNNIFQVRMNMTKSWNRRNNQFLPESKMATTKEERYPGNDIALLQGRE